MAQLGVFSLTYMFPKCDERRSNKEIAEDNDTGKNSCPPLLKCPTLRANGNLEQDGLEGPSNGYGDEETDGQVIRKQPARKEADDVDNDVGDERGPESGAQRELDTANQSTQEE